MKISLNNILSAVVVAAMTWQAQAASPTLTFNFQSTNGSGHTGSGAIPGVEVIGATSTAISYTPAISSGAINAPVVVNYVDGTLGASVLNISFANTGGTDLVSIGYDNDGNAGNFNYGPGVGTGFNGGNEIDGATNNVTITFDKPVVLTSVQGAWWDAGVPKGDDSYQLTVGAETRLVLTSQEGALNSLTDATKWVGATGFTSSTIDGVTGVYLPAGQAFVFKGADTDGDNVFEDDGLLQRFSFNVVNPVPEPTTIGLAGLGLLGLLRRRRA